MARIAHVYILDIPYHADKPYSYLIPAVLEDSVVPGSVVQIPFGKGNRRMTGVVTEIRTEEAGELKPITSTMGEGRILSEELIGLCRFMKEYTLCTFGDAVRSVIPAAAMAKVITYYRVIPKEEMEQPQKLDALLRSLSDRARMVYDLAAQKPRFTRQYLQSELEFDCTRILWELERAGLCEKSTRVRDSQNLRQKKIVHLSAQLKSRMAEDDRALQEICRSLRGENQKKLLTAVAEEEGLDLLTLCEEAGMTAAAGRVALSALVEKGYLQATLEEEYRNPFSMESMKAFGERKSTVPTLTAEQEAAKNQITALYKEGKPGAALLHGVTGSGKTNVILAAIDEVLADGRGVIMLVPEIALTPQTVGIFMGRYGDKIAVIHSGLSAGERYDAWRRIRDGLAPVVVGTRSAIFAPLPNIGMIVIDEEHEYTYKSDMPPKYHAHDIARYRCKDHNAVMVLSSATPSVTSYYKAKKGVYSLIELKERYGNAVLPSVEIYDMRGETQRGNLSPVGSLLAERMRLDKEDGNQSILFLNRRGYNNYVSCRGCGKSIKCPSCSVTMTYHAKKGRKSYGEETENIEKERRENGFLICHTCGTRLPVPEKCPDSACESTHFLYMGCGTQKAEDDIVSLFPDLRILRMDLDTTRAKFSHEEILAKFRSGEADVLLGTQMVTKGHDFPRVATVGVLNADGAFQADDYRAGERTFAMLTQVIGRAGRGDVPGNAIIQTYDPSNEVLRYAAQQDYPRFYEGEIRLRQALCFPPFCDMAVITLACEDEGYLGLVTTRMGERIKERLQLEFPDLPIILYGPFEAPVYRVQNTCRMRFVLKCRLNKRMRQFLDELICEFSRSTPAKYTRTLPSARSNRRVSVSVDLNPSTV